LQDYSKKKKVYLQVTYIQSKSNVLKALHIRIISG